MTSLIEDRFEVGERLGAGSMGVVFAAVDHQLRREVALKTLPTLAAEDLAALKAEFRIRKSLAHPNVVALYELFAADERCFFTMERIAGRSFAKALAATCAAKDEARARHLVTQLVHGVAATHDAGILHRDLKPDNILVESAGRVVLLDFGLAVRATQHAGDVSGTLAYMAPEALWGRSSAASDWFSVGALLYEAIAGELPWPPRELGWRSRRVAAEAVITQHSWAWLGVLVDELLAVDVSARPTGDQLCVRFPDDRTTFTRRMSAPFTGRETELAELAAARARTQTGETCIVSLRGPSGAGKSRLLGHFLGQLRGEPGTAVLEGACHHTEHLPLAALDPLIDELAALLRSPAFKQMLAEAPPIAAAARLFPTLADLSAETEATETAEATETLLPTELRHQALSALRHLLRWLSGHVFLVISIDDAQWGDAASAAILRELLDPSEGARALVILSSRTGESEGPLVDALAGTESTATCIHVDVGPLDDAGVAALLRQAAAIDDTQADRLVRQANGSPFIALELARALRAGGAGVGEASPAALLSLRLAALSDDERRLARLASLAGRPLPRSLVLDAAGLLDGGLLTTLALEQASILAGFPGDEPQLGIYHDQIRRALLDELAGEDMRSLHGELADALERAPRDEPELLLTHLLEAGRNERAITVAFTAADAAAARLAFERAAEILQRALDAGAVGPVRVDVLRRQGAAWRDAGIGARATESFHAAAELADQVADAESEALWTDTAEEMVRHGRVEEGEAIFRRLLAQQRVRLPRRPAVAMALGLARRVRLWWRGFDSPVDVSAIPPADLARQELMWKAANSLSLTQFPFSFCLTGALLHEALERGNRLQLVRTLGSEAAFSAALGGPRFNRRAESLMARVEALVTETDDALLHAGLHSYRGIVAWNRGRFRDTVRACDAFSELIRRELPGRAWDLAVSDVHTGSALYHLGEAEALAARVPGAIAAASDRGDRFAVNQLRLGDSGSYLLLRGDYAGARRVLAEAEAELSLGPTIETYYYTLLRLRLELAEARPGDAWSTIERLWPRLEAGQILAVEMARCLLHHLRGQALLGLLRETSDARGRRRHERALNGSLRALRRVSAPQGGALALDLEARRLRDDARGSEPARRARACADTALRSAGMFVLVGPG